MVLRLASRQESTQLKGRILTNKVEEYNIATLIHNVVPKVTIFGREGKKLGV